MEWILDLYKDETSKTPKAALNKLFYGTSIQYIQLVLEQLWVLGVEVVKVVSYTVINKHSVVCRMPLLTLGTNYETKIIMVGLARSMIQTGI